MYRIVLTVIIAFITIDTFAQQLPVGTWGIVNKYDAAGNRIKRVYFYNNGVDPYPGKIAEKLASGEVVQVVEIEALYPNPTTGKFTVAFSKALQDAAVTVMDLQGKKMLQFKTSGHKTDFDLSGVAAGVYFIRIENEGQVITKKVIKQ